MRKLRSKHMRIVRLMTAMNVAASLVAGLPEAWAKPAETTFTPPAGTRAPADFPSIFPDGKYRFEFRWNGIPSAESELIVSRFQQDGQPNYRFEGTARTSKAADIFWKFRAHAVAIVDAVSGRASKIRVAERQNSKLKEYETVFDYGSSEAHYTRWKKGRVREKKIKLEGDAIDPIFLGVTLSQQPLEVGDRPSFTVLVGDNPYALELRVVACDRISWGGHEVDAFRIEPIFHKLEDGDKSSSSKVKEMTVWLSKSAPRLPIRMKSKTLIGYVTGEMVELTPADPDPARTLSVES